MLRRTKVGGILAEASDGAVVLGIGVNLNQTHAELPERGGSLRTTTGEEWDRDAVLDAVLADLDNRYDAVARAAGSTRSTRASAPATSSAAAR